MEANQKREAARSIASEVKKLQTEMEENKVLFETKLDKNEEKIINEVETLNKKLLSEMNAKDKKSCTIS